MRRQLTGSISFLFNYLFKCFNSDLLLNCLFNVVILKFHVFLMLFRSPERTFDSDGPSKGSEKKSLEGAGTRMKAKGDVVAKMKPEGGTRMKVEDETTKIMVETENTVDKKDEGMIRRDRKKEFGKLGSSASPESSRVNMLF